MKMKLSTVLLTLGLASLVLCQSLRLVFSETDTGQVLRALSMRTGISIVYSSQEKIPITIDVSANSAEDALKGIVSAAGLSYRRVNNTYIVAKPANLRQAIEPYGFKDRIDLVNMDAKDAVALLDQGVPFLTTRPAGRSVMLIGARSDVILAKELITTEEQRLKGTVREVVPVKYVAVDKLVGALKTLYPTMQMNYLSIGPLGGTISLVGARDAVRQVRGTIDELDAAAQAGLAPVDDFLVYDIKYSTAPVLKQFLEQALPELKVIVGSEVYSPVEPMYRAIKGVNLGNSGSSSGGTGTSSSNNTSSNTGTGGSGGSVDDHQPYARVDLGDRAKKLLLRGNAAMLAQAQALLAQVDHKPKQVMVEVKVVDTSPQALTDLGVTYNWDRFQFIESAPGTLITPTKSADPGSQWESIPLKKGNLGFFGRVPWQLDAILHAITTRKDTKILANPRLQVMDNDDATIFVGDTIRARLISTGALGAQNVQIQEFPVGIILLFRPRVNADGNITLRVHPVVSAITSVDAFNIPQTSTREAETTVVLKDGESIVIGGLIRDEMRRTVTEVPILAQIPILGELFRSTSTDRRKSEVMVFITAKVIPDSETGATKVSEDKK